MDEKEVKEKLLKIDSDSIVFSDPITFAPSAQWHGSKGCVSFIVKQIGNQFTIEITAKFLIFKQTLVLRLKALE